jgi:hypothetical protein
MAVVSKNDYRHGGGQWWAEPDHAAAVEAMRRAALNGSDVRRLAARARADRGNTPSKRSGRLQRLPGSKT